MKPIVMNENVEKSLMKMFAEKFMKALDDFKLNPSDSKLSVSLDVSQEAKDKVTILYTSQAYLRMQALVDYFDTEVGWYGLVQQLNDKLYKVYDVKLCKQYVNGSKVDTEDDDTLEFFNSLTDDEAEHMHFQAHSHVRMSTTASGVDIQNQSDVIRNMGSSGFYIFQIWNKSNDINTYLYDLDNNVFYDSKDVLIEIEDSERTINDWLADVDKLVLETKVTYPYSFTPGKVKYKKGKRVEEYQPEYYNNYYKGGYNY